MVERSDDDAAARAREVGVAVDVDHQVEPDRQQQLVQPASRAFGVGRDDDAMTLPEQLGDAPAESFAVADDRPPSHRLDHRGLGPVGHREEGPGARRRVREQVVEGRVQARELGALRSPGLAQARREVGLLGQDLAGAVAHAAGLDQHDLRVGVQEVDEGVLTGREPRHPRLHAIEHEALGETLPLLTTPGLGTDEGRGAGADVVGGQQLAAREDLDLGEVSRRALVVHAELGEAVDLVAPQVDAHRAAGRSGRSWSPNRS